MDDKSQEIQQKQIQKKEKKLQQAKQEDKNFLEIFISKTFWMSQLLPVIGIIFLIMFVSESKVKLPYSFILFTFFGKLGIFLEDLFNKVNIRKQILVVFDLVQFIGFAILMYINSTVKANKPGSNNNKSWINKCLI